jgi:predicted unusual protein kinase regulating ubiquinone biosynthesis (AarF/ABC1/UbiB family)
MKSPESAEQSLVWRARRITQITGLLSRLVLQVAPFNRSSEEASVRSRRLAAWTREQFVELGPTFIKLGQIISARADLFPSEWIEEMVCLQDDVNPFSFSVAKEVIESELGGPIDRFFDYVSEDPLAVASIGQIHRADVTVDGRRVELVIKVQRPGVRALVTGDLAVMRSVVDHLKVIGSISRRMDLDGLVDELDSTFKNELDYRIEADNTELFARNFADPFYGVIVPKVDRQRSSEKVLTLQYVAGTKISSFEGSNSDTRELAAMLVRAFMKMFVIDGVFHADPHPGNMAVTRDPDGKPLLILYDFGMIGRLSKELRDALIKLAGAAIAGDLKTLMDQCIAAGLLSEKVREDQDVIDVLARFIKRPEDVSARSIGLLQSQIARSSEQGELTFPRELTLVGRSLTSLEGNLRRLQGQYPDLRLSNIIFSEALPIAGRLMGEPIQLVERSEFDLGRLSKFAVSLLRRFRRTYEELESGELKVDVRDSASNQAIRRLKFGFKSLTSAVIFSALFVPGVLIASLSSRQIMGWLLSLASIYFLKRCLDAEDRLGG